MTKRELCNTTKCKLHIQSSIDYHFGQPEIVSTVDVTLLDKIGSSGTCELLTQLNC